ALDNSNLDSLREELGDLLFEIVFLARIAEEGGHFSVGDAAADVAAKLVRRHPHVFGDEARLSTADQVRGKWEEMKRAERDDGTLGEKTLLGGVPRTLPSLLRAYEYGSRAAAVGFDWVRAADVIEKIEEEVHELRDQLRERGELAAAEQAERVEEEMGACCLPSPTCPAS
ncbi:MAG TPA: MazG nucleotide pyrophosphohydrolase domain-containing protein, partial [Chloroflexota bacterium]|nr:MazG nucleotide pyrophosphohydrolase domain-containing protein [Chloroflexota bacterium]